jgi:nicotinamide riboside transporter PnuC
MGTVVLIAVALVVAVTFASMKLQTQSAFSRTGRLMILVLVAGLAVGTATHVENFMRAGFRPRPELPLACNLFWSSLTVVDPLVALLLLARPRVGVWVVVTLVAVDLCVNIAMLGFTAPVLAQLGYGLLCAAAVPVVRRTANPK